MDHLHINAMDTQRKDENAKKNKPCLLVTHASSCPLVSIVLGTATSVIDIKKKKPNSNHDRFPPFQEALTWMRPAYESFQQPFPAPSRKLKPPGFLKGLGNLLTPKPSTSPNNTRPFVPSTPNGPSTPLTAPPFLPPVSPYQEYPGALQKSRSTPGEWLVSAAFWTTKTISYDFMSTHPLVRPRHNSLPTAPLPLRSDSWPNNSMTPPNYNPRAGSHKRSVSFIANKLTGKQTVATQAAHSSLRSRNQPRNNLPDLNHVVERPLKMNINCKRLSLFSSLAFLNPWLVAKQNYELHTYLSTPPFSYSFLNRPDTITRKGFHGLHQYATRPPTSYMVIESPHLPWSIRIGGRTPDDKYLSVSEVFTAIYEALRQSPTAAELNILYASSESKKKYREITSAYHKRSKRENPYQQDYIRKIDWLCGRDVFDGLIRKKDKDKPAWTIRFRGAGETRFK